MSRSNSGRTRRHLVGITIVGSTIVVALSIASGWVSTTSVGAEAPAVAVTGSVARFPRRRGEVGPAGARQPGHRRLWWCRRCVRRRDRVGAQGVPAATRTHDERRGRRRHGARARTRQQPAARPRPGCAWQGGVKKLQQALIDAGIDVPGGVDGVFGAGTKTAVEQFQRQRRNQADRRRERCDRCGVGFGGGGGQSDRSTGGSARRQTRSGGEVRLRVVRCPGRIEDRRTRRRGQDPAADDHPGRLHRRRGSRRRLRCPHGERAAVVPERQRTAGHRRRRRRDREAVAAGHRGCRRRWRTRPDRVVTAPRVAVRIDRRRREGAPAGVGPARASGRRAGRTAYSAPRRSRR